MVIVSMSTICTQEVNTFNIGYRLLESMDGVAFYFGPVKKIALGHGLEIFSYKHAFLIAIPRTLYRSSQM